VEVDKANKANNADGHASTDFDDRINVENKTNDEQAESIIHDGFEMNDASMTIEQELQVEAALDSVEVDKADKATDAYGHARTDSDDRIDVENMANDEPEDLMIHDGFETNDANDEQSELMMYDGFEMNDASTTIKQELQVEAALDNVEVDKADKAIDAYGNASTDSGDRIDVDNKANEGQGDLMIHDGFETNDASTIIEQELQVDTVTHKQKNTLVEGGSKNIG
jgi:hypothetical protein